MKSTPLIINWHESNSPIYSAHFEPHGRGRLATGGGDRNVRLWKVEADGENRRVEYLSTLAKHTQAVNVVRWAPKGELLASAGDDGNVILWVQADIAAAPAFGSEGLDDKETWRAKHMCRSSGAEIYDLAWSPDSQYFIIGSMDNIARIYSAHTGTIVRQVADHSHYVQGVAWDPHNEYIATQSSDRSVHIYALRTKDGQYTLTGPDNPSKIASHTRADLPSRRISSHSPAPPDFGFRASASAGTTPQQHPHQPQHPHQQHPQQHPHQQPQLSVEGVGGAGSPVPSMPGTPTSMMAQPMNPPSVMSHSHSHSRRSSLSSSRRSLSPAPSMMPLPAVMPYEASPKPHHAPPATVQGAKNTALYINETLTSFFRRLTFTPDGALLLTPSGQYQSQLPAGGDRGRDRDPDRDRDGRDREKPGFEVINTVYIYSRGGINKPPIAHLPGHKKPSVVVKCSPVVYELRAGPAPKTRHVTIDTSSAEDPIPSLPEPMTSTTTSTASTAAAAAAAPAAATKPSPSPMEPPPPPPPVLTNTTSATAAAAATPDAGGSSSSNKAFGSDASPATAPAPAGVASGQGGPPPAFSMPYRVVYAVATQDSVLLYDTQQKTPFCVVSNLHCAAFTDLTWSSDGLTLLISSSDGFCSTLSFPPGELGKVYPGELLGPKAGAAASSCQGAAAPTPAPTSAFVSPSAFAANGGGGGPHHRTPTSSFTAPSPPPPPLSAMAAAMAQSGTPVRPSSPARSNSNSSISSAAPVGGVLNNPPLIGGTIPSITASKSATITSVPPITTPPETPRSSGGTGTGGSTGGGAATGSVAGSKRDASESEREDEGRGKDSKKRRITPAGAAAAEPSQ